ncbi:MAG: DNA-processing protein DprA [Lachnospiraceae bacterium]|nr:DNA-processing protein DprA [Lachnospiraceae bacterium]
MLQTDGGAAMTDREKAYMHWLYQAVGMGNRGTLKRLKQIGTPEEIYGLAKQGRLAERLSDRYRNKAEQITACAAGYDVAAEYEKLIGAGISFVTGGEPSYPRRLAMIPDAPCALYYVGKLPDDEKPAIAIIGARNCSEYGRGMAKQFGEALASAGVQIVSGMARGIDGIGQGAALQADGYSLGVLGCGVDICYPPDNKELYEELIASGGICSEYPPGTTPRAVLFPPRNRIISGLCDGVLVIEAKERSGTLITVDMALEQGREVYALPGRATDLLSLGCNRLIRQGAALVTSPQELLRDLGVSGSEKEDYRQQTLFLPEGVQGRLFELLDYQPKSMEQLQQEYANLYGSRLSVPELCRELLGLCADGYAGRIGGNYYVKKM